MSNMRISGMFSGMDTDTMVQSMMKAERMKLTRFEQNKQIALWRQESYNSINKMFANFILNTKKDIGISSGSSFNSSYSKLDYVKKATSSNEMAATVSSTSKAVNGSFSFEVKEMATSATYASADVKGVTIAGANLQFKVKLGAEEETISVNASNGTNVTMEDVAKAINKESKNTTAFYDKINGRLFIQSKETGSKGEIELNAIASNTASESLVNALKGSVGNIADSKSGKDAEILFNGVTPLKYSSNNFELNGVNIELKKAGEITTINVSTNVEGIMDKVKKLVEDYNALIDVTSGLLGEKKYPSYKPLSTEERNGMKENDVKLWDEKAKSGLLSNDETINRALQTMRNSLYKTRLDQEGNKVEGFNHITQIGITTEAYAKGAAGGKLQIDTEKLRKAIEDDPEGVMELLFGEPKYGEEPLAGVSALSNERNLSAKQINAKRDQSGVFTRVFDDLIAGMKNIIDKSGSGNNGDLLRSVHQFMLTDFTTTKSSISDIDKSITEMNRQMDNLNILFARKEESYYAKFTQMEKYMQQMSSQSSWIGQQLMR